jgi:acyl-CoA thioesterase-1
MIRTVSRILLILTVFLPVCAIAQPPVKVLILGNSLSAAYNMPLEQGWVNLLQERVNKAYPGTTIINASISGETAANAVNRLPQLITEHKPDIIVIELGGNDGLRGFRLPDIEQNLQSLIDISRNADAVVVLTGIHLHPNYGAKFNTLFMNMFTKLAEKNKTGLVPFILEGIGDKEGRMQADGIHPNAGAQGQVLDNMWPAIEAAIHNAGPFLPDGV